MRLPAAGVVQNERPGRAWPMEWHHKTIFDED